jgi:hypothetical protein
MTSIDVFLPLHYLLLYFDKAFLVKSLDKDGFNPFDIVSENRNSSQASLSGIR